MAFSRRTSKLSWWQKTRATAFAFAFAGTVFALIIVTSGLNLTSGQGIARLGWIAQSAFPIAILLLIALFTRVQRKIDLRSGGNASSEPENRVEAR